MPDPENDAAEGADSTLGGTRPSKRARLSEEQQQDESLLPAPLWASVLSYLAFDDMKKCTALNRTFLTEIAPQVTFAPSFTLKIRVPRAWGPLIEVNRFQGAQRVEISASSSRSIVTPSAVRRILLDLGSDLVSLAVHGLDSEDGYEAEGPDESFDHSRVQFELGNAFLPVRATLRKLKIGTLLYPELILPAVVTAFQGLVRLELDDINRQMWDWYNKHKTARRDTGSLPTVNDKVSFGRSIQVLAELPNLTELKLRCSDYDDLNCDPDIVSGFMLGCSRIKNLRVLESIFLIDWCDFCEDSFAIMMAGLENLEVLSKVTYPNARLWQNVATAGGGSQLKELFCYYSEVDEEEDHLRSLVEIILNQFPLLTSVSIQLENHFHLPGGLDGTVRIFAPLKEHPRLTKIKFYINSSMMSEVDSKSAVTRLQELVGSRIQVEECGYMF